jgi:diacylglycerol kinase (ATP)
MRVLFIINPTAGANQAGTRWTALEGRLRQAGVQAEPRFTTAPGEATEVARQAAGVYDLMVAVGGDGTASEVADGLLSAKSNPTALAVMPFGTGNDFAAALGVRTEADAYLATRSLEVEADQPLEVAADGDLVGYTPARFEIRAKVLQVWVPQSP